MPLKTKLLEIDGRVGEGGGQLVRNCIALSSVVGTPVRIVNVRGNRPGARGGGLKAQHISGIGFLTTAAGSEVLGLELGSKTLEFRPKLTPTSFAPREVTIEPTTLAASCTLVFQAVFPFLLFAANETNEPISLRIHGGTNVNFSPSTEYIQAVLLPSLEQCFGIRVEFELQGRGWNQGPSKKGCMSLKIHPVPRGKTLRLQRHLEVPQNWNGEPDDIDAFIVTPSHLHAGLRTHIVDNLSLFFPSTKVNFAVVEESGHDARIYVLLVAKKATESGMLRWGRDILGSGAKAGRKDYNKMSVQISARVCEDLKKEVQKNGVVDEYLEDQLIIFQALAEGRSSFPSMPDGSLNNRVVEGKVGEEETKEDGTEGSTRLEDSREVDIHGGSALSCRGDLKAALPAASDRDALSAKSRVLQKVKSKTRASPFGQGSLHAKTCRWLTSEVLERTEWYQDGQVVEGIAARFEG